MVNATKSCKGKHKEEGGTGEKETGKGFWVSYSFSQATFPLGRREFAHEDRH